MAIQEFDLGVKDPGSIYPLMAQFMASMSKNAEDIGNNIRSSMLRTEANTQTKDMSTAIKGAELFNPNGTSKPDSMTKLMSIAAAFPLGASTPVGRMMFSQLGSQIEYNMPIAGTPGAQTTTTSDGAGAGTATTFGLNPDGTVDTQDNGVGFKGANTRDPNLVGVALHPDDLKGAGIPYRDWKNVVVEVTNPQTGQTQRGKVVDLLGNKDASIDLTYGMTKAVGADGKTPVNWKIVGVDTGSSNPPTASNNALTGSPMDMFREPITAIDKRIATLQSMLPAVVTKGNHVLYDNALNQISRLEAQKSKLIEQSAVQTRADAREKLAQDKASRDERRLDMMQERIDAADKRGDDATASRLRTEHRMEIKDQLEPVQKDIAQLETQLRDSRKSYESYSTAIVQETDPKKKAQWTKKARDAQKEMQGIQQKIDAKQEQASGLTQRLSNLDGSSDSAPTKKQPTQADVSKAFSDANGDRAKAKELLKSRGYAID
jgi:hypothetical protein